MMDAIQFKECNANIHKSPRGKENVLFGRFGGACFGTLMKCLASDVGEMHIHFLKKRDISPFYDDLWDLTSPFFLEQSKTVSE